MPGHPLDVDLKPHTTPLLSKAYSLTTLYCGSSPLVVGTTVFEGDTEERDATPVYWKDFSLTSECFQAMEFADFFTNGSGVPRDVNEGLNVVGYNCLPSGNTEEVCGQELALYWDSIAADRFVLPIPSDLTPTASVRAVAINTPQAGVGESLLRAVGWAGGATGTDAILWEKQSGQWAGLNLNNDATLVNNVPLVNRGHFAGGPQWELLEAHDINNIGFGSIVGKAQRGDLPSGNPNRAFLLTPLGSCPEDNNPVNPDGTAGNGVINIDDLVGVLTGFGACPSGAICYADVNGDFHVNIDDLVAVLNNFGPTGCAAPANPGMLALELTDISNSFAIGWPDENGVITPSTLVADAWAAQQAVAPLTVLRLWAVLPDANSSLSYAGGGLSSGTAGASEPLVLSAGKGAQFFVANNDYSSSVNVALLDVNGGAGFEWFQSQAWATHLFMGGTSGPTKFGDLTALDAILTGAVNTPDSGWGVIGSVAGQPDGNGGWRVLIGQFAVPQGSAFTAAVRLAGDGIDTYATINSTSQVLSP